MLIQFYVENFLSFKEEACLNMIASKRIKKHPTHVFTVHNNFPVLRTGAIYGANASGKSNLIKAISFSINYITQDKKKDQPTGSLPFKLDIEFLNKPSKFEFVFEHKDTIYRYGFVLDRERVMEEWLLSRTTSKEKIIFTRETNKEGTVKVEPGRSLLEGEGSVKRGYLKYVEKGISKNKLFLSEANDKNVEMLSNVFKWFKDNIYVIAPTATYSTLIPEVDKNLDFAMFLSSFLKFADTGISGIFTEKKKINLEQVDLPQEIKSDLLNSITPGKGHLVLFEHPIEHKSFLVLNENGEYFSIGLSTNHLDSGGKEVKFGLSEESDGTNRIMNVSPSLFHMKHEGLVFIIDELDRSIHPNLLLEFLKIFHMPETHQKSQLIFSTHETHLLDLDLLRSDEIYFVEKDNNSNSKLFSLSDFKPRFDLEIGRHYLNGRFGAIPFLGDFKKLGIKTPKKKKE